MIQTFKQCMRCLLEERQISRTDWPKLTQEITFVCNSLVNVSTGLTPHEIMFGERLRGGVEPYFLLENMLPTLISLPMSRILNLEMLTFI